MLTNWLSVFDHFVGLTLKDLTLMDVVKLSVILASIKKLGEFNPNYPKFPFLYPWEIQKTFGF